MSKFLTREEYHAQKGKKIYTKEDCPFCDKSNQQEYVIWEGKFWYILYNKAPYSGNEQHIMVIPYSHKVYSYDLVDDEISELKDIHVFVKKFFGENNYFSFTRESMANRSVEHLHMHFLAGKLQGKYLRKMLENQGFPIKEDLKW